MEEERSLMIDIVGDVMKAPLPKASTSRSSSDASSGGAASDAVEADVEDIIDPRELARSYDFGASSVTVSRIRQLESLGYMNQGRRLCQSQTQMKLLSSKIFLLRDCGCRLIMPSLRFCSNSGCSCVSGP
jgi:hypothetical protein